MSRAARASLAISSGAAARSARQSASHPCSTLRPCSRSNPSARAAQPELAGSLPWAAAYSRESQIAAAAARGSVSAGPEARVGLFDLEERAVDVLEPPQRAPETQVRLGLVAFGQRGLECGARGDPVALRQRRVAGDRSASLHTHPRIVT